MVDQNKRKTLKIISGAGTAALSGTVLTGTAMTAVSHAAVPSNADRAVSTAHNLLKIQIITGRNAPEDTVVFVNDTEKEIIVNQFLPGIVTHNNQMIDLNALLTSGDIIVKPGYPVASKVASWEVLSLEPNQSYLWGDTAVTKLPNSDPNSDTGVININAAVANGRAMLTAVHEEIAFS